MNNTQRECCSKCWKNRPHSKECKSCEGEGFYPAECVDKDCPCHTLVHEDHKKDGDTEVSLATPTQRVDEWSEEFDKRFGVPCVIEEDGLPSFAPQIKSFIRENRAALLDRLGEEVGKLMKAGDYSEDALLKFEGQPLNERTFKKIAEQICDGRQNAVLKEVQSLITNFKKEI